METFIEPIKLSENPYYKNQRQKNIASIRYEALDEPIIELIRDFNKLSFCFTLQSCYGHFIYGGQNDPYNLESLPDSKTIVRIEYKIAYIAFCIDNSDSGKRFFNALAQIPVTDPENIQFCCAEWFWKRQLNSYVLQVEPDRFKYKDKVSLDYAEALKIEKTRNQFFVQLKELLQNKRSILGAD